MNLPTRSEVEQLRQDHRRFLPITDPEIERERRMARLCAGIGLVAFLLCVALVAFILCAKIGGL